ncbi:DeoR family transcriptional regulator [Paenibacillus sp. FSL H8-0548]|uniref:DeoR/GlpR family DNA-binding transcription regulator n=1 Tax=Paenibacillus sp. FSL H8-0548 TaxID=1920422 RepID=UPI00096CE4AB|nr:DeoR/GlpR family DNA-binding transcription regulator [Paenibacillus sp. FSL H8-0548]OMF34578.1 DeoR family transcriptional regulator [Paenibacillus sp. FSL H8-0548]
MKPSLYQGLNARQQQMLEHFSREGELRIAALKETYQVTEMTIRRDLEKLEEAGAIKRTFGGAIFVGKDIALQERAGILTEEKAKIGRYAASLICTGESIFIDGGTTTLQLAKFLPSGMNITVVTNALNVAAELSGKQIPVLVTGGMLLEATNSLVGPIAAQSLASMAFDRAFLGATGLNIEHGFSNSNIYEAEIKQTAIRQASETNILLDHSKFGAKVLVSFVSLSGVDRIVSDQWPDESLQLACREAGVRLEVAN